MKVNSSTKFMGVSRGLGLSNMPQIFGRSGCGALVPREQDPDVEFQRVARPMDSSPD
jgi:hypothetical protein